jgi:hypothetical protein
VLLEWREQPQEQQVQELGLESQAQEWELLALVQVSE